MIYKYLDDLCDDISQAIQNFYDKGILTESPSEDYSDEVIEYNCRSCGAPLNPNAERCEYCKTYVSYAFKKQKPEEIYSL